MTDQDILARWKEEPGPLLPVLHAFHARDGYLSEDAIRAVSRGLRIPLADLYGTITFYHHFARVPGGLDCPRVCTGPVCVQEGALDLLRELAPEGATGMPCSGRCDDPVPVLRGHLTLAGRSAADLVARPAPLPPPAPDGAAECVFRTIREPGHATLAGYRRDGGYEGLARAVGEMTPGQVVEAIDRSGLAGRGGAGFPTGRKWRAVAEADGTPKSIVCNADEGEPGCFKDRALMDYDPHAVIEGMIASGYATGAHRGFIYLRYEYPETEDILAEAIREAEEAGILGASVMGSGFAFDLHIRRGAGAYICGEETSLLNSMEGKHPFPRNRPPFPVTHGFEDLPTVVNNVETLASVPHILALGAEWYAGLGMNGHAGTKVISLSGDILRPGNYEVPMGFPLERLLYDWAGGPFEGRTIQAVTMAGALRGIPGGRRSLRHAGRTRDPRAQVVPGRGGDHGVRRLARHGRGGARRDGVLRPRILRQVLPLPHRHPAADGAACRRGRTRRGGGVGGRSCGHWVYHEGNQRVRAGNRCPADHGEPHALFSRGGFAPRDRTGRPPHGGAGLGRAAWDGTLGSRLELETGRHR